MILPIILLILILDQLSKFLIIKNLSTGESVAIIKGVFHLTLVCNRGAAFGMLKNQLPLFIFTAVIAVVLIYFNLKSEKERHFSLYRLALCFILAGGLGNLIDRLRFGYVVDFLDFRIWPVFNLADSAITIGALLLAYTLLKPQTQK